MVLLYDLCLILVGVRVPIVLGGASKQGNGKDGLKKLKFKWLPENIFPRGT